MRLAALRAVARSQNHDIMVALPARVIEPKFWHEPERVL